MKFIVQTIVGLSLALAVPAFAANKPVPAQAGLHHPAHLKAVQELLSVMQAEKVMRQVAGRSRYQSEAQRKRVFSKLANTPATEVHRRLAPALALLISTDTAIEMTRFYSTPYGKQVIHAKYNSGPSIMMPGMTTSVPPEEKKARKRPAYVKASKELAAAEPLLEREAFKLLQLIDHEKR